MKLHFESDLPYQKDAVAAICDLFRGQETGRTEFTVLRAGQDTQQGLAFNGNDLGIGNRLKLLDDELLKNLNEVQLRNALEPTQKLASGDFTVEMETGTGKTYVYLRTIFELNKKYGFTKFVIVVPSVAIREGVAKTLEMTKDHFCGLYAGAPYDWFVYDSSELGTVRDFATSPHIRVMVVTVGAINKFGDEEEAAAEEADEAKRKEKSKNVMYRASEKTSGEKPIDLIRATQPILIVDEPQSVDGGLEGRGRQALSRMNPLCTLRYSATHVDKHHMVYRLDAVDAYERRLVKQIEVAAGTIEQAHNKPYVRLVSTRNQRGAITATVELDKRTPTGAVQRTTVVLQDGDDLEQTTGRAVYRNLRIGEIRTGKGQQFVELRVPGDVVYLRPGEAYGDVEPLALQRELIRRTIKEHLDKERLLRPRGIKVLSLFFIDAVNKYRLYDADGNPQMGEYARLFEEEYARWAKHPDYVTLFKEVDLHHAAHEVHGGYFSIDKKKIAGKQVEVVKDTSGSTKADDDTYALIMKDKERLLSLETPLKFIFSHSALREGWDNPNVFQICTLREIRTEGERRQTIGRGLRICVNQQGERVRGFDVNTLTVIANESYEEFAENLQKEIEKDTDIRFGVVQTYQFAAIPVPGTDGVAPLGVERSKEVWEHLHEKGYIDAHGRVQDALRRALHENHVSVPAGFEAQRQAIMAVLEKLAGKLNVKNADERRRVPTRRAVLDSPDFKELWERIKHKTTYRVHFDNDKLLADCTKALRAMPPVTRTRLEWRKADVKIGKGGVDIEEQDHGAETRVLNESDVLLPDLLTNLQDRTQLTRRSLYTILTQSGRLGDFRKNPQQFLDEAAKAVNRCKQIAIVEGIKYERLGSDAYYAQELFESEELNAYLKESLESRKSVYERVRYDSNVERDFAEGLEKNDAVKVYAKLPGWFQVKTPLGNYNPDWAVLITTDEGERLYFVVETKDTLSIEALRDTERAKIACGEKHFAALESGTRYVVGRTVEELLAAHVTT